MSRQSIASFVKFLLDAAWWAVAVGLGLLVIVLACSFLVEIRGDNLTLSLPVSVEVDAPVVGVEGESNAHFEKLRGNLRFPARKGAFFSGSVAVVVLMFGYVLWIVTQLRSIFRSLSRGLPFVEGNARRIRYIGVAVILGETGRAIIVYFWSHYTSLHFTMSGAHFAPSADISLITIVSGLAILVIAEVFREGARLQEDQSLTI